MMRQMREATKPIMLFTAVAFVGLMVFQWGMDITGRSGGGLGPIGQVNGDPVMHDEYIMPDASPDLTSDIPPNFHS